MAKRGRNAQQKRGAGRQKRFTPSSRNVSPAAEVYVCDYCFHTDWRTDKRQRYCTPSRERKLAHQRRAALVELLYRLFPWRLTVTLDVVRRMVEAAERALLMAVRCLGWMWDEGSKQFAWFEAEGAKAA